jgi:hypothetical protein
MNKLKITLLLASGLLSFQAFAQTDGSGISRYCQKKEGVEAKGKVVEVNGSHELRCDGSHPTFQAYFEQTNFKLGRTGEEKVDEEFLQSDKWDEYARKELSSIIISKMKDVDASKCKQISKISDNKYVVKCTDGKEHDVSQMFPSMKNILGSWYVAGSKEYAKDESKTKLRDYFSAAKLEKSNVTVKFSAKPYIIKPIVTADFWDDMLKKSQVILDKPITDGQYNIYKWDVPGQLTNENNPALSWQKYSNYQPIKIADENLNTPVTDATVIILPPSNEIPVVKTEEIVDAKVVPQVEVVEEKEIVVKEDENANCSDELKNEIAKLLALDGNNIIGLQYELTVMKMASHVVGADRVSLEGLIKKHSQEIAKADTGILDNMKQVYLRHGVKEDEQKVLDHLKEKSNSANYYAKEKRFFNQDSSAFLMAFQNLNPESGIKDADISVLWFMDKVSEKASAGGKYSSAHNRTNLSTRIAQYTGAIDPSKALKKEALDDMVNKQKALIDSELMGVIESFKVSNKACYDQIFSDGEEDCNQGKVQEFFSQLLADISSKATSQDMVKLDAGLKGEINGNKFNISRFVDKKPVAVVIEAKEVIIIPEGGTVIAEETMPAN